MDRRGGDNRCRPSPCSGAAGSRRLRASASARPRPPSLGSLPMRIADLGREHPSLAVRGNQLAGDALGLAFGVAVGGIDEVDRRRARAESTMRPASAASVRSPNIIVPRQSAETLIPLLPSLRYSMVVSLVLTRSWVYSISLRSRPNHFRMADPGLVIFSIDPVIPAYAGIRVAGGRPAAGLLFLRGQSKVTKEKAAPGSPRLRVPCVTRRVRGLWNSLRSNEKTH